MRVMNQDMSVMTEDYQLLSDNACPGRPVLPDAHSRALTPGELSRVLDGLWTELVSTLRPVLYWVLS